MKKLSILPLLIALLMVAGCNKNEEKTGTAGPSSSDSSDKVIRFIMSDIGFNSEIVPVLKQEVEKQGFTLQWIVVNDIIQPNKMVEDGAADGNSMQHEPYFDQFVADHHLHNVAKAFYTILTTSGLYSKKYHALDQVPDGATFGIPVDLANNGRALFMLQDHGLLKLRVGVDVVHASLRDIIDNPHHFKFKEVDQLMLLRALDDVDVGFLFSLYAMKAGFDIKKDALAIEDPDKIPYKSLVVVRKELLGTPKILALQKAYASEAIKSLYRAKYGDAIYFLDQQNLVINTPLPAKTAEVHLSFVRSIINVWPEIVQALGQTLYMLIITIPLAVLFGTPLGTVLYLTRPGSFLHRPRLYILLNALVNLVRSFPFLILMIALIPVTRLIVGTALGTTAATVPMILSSIPYFARFIEQTLLEVNRGVVEAAESMGATLPQIIWKVLYTEARSGIANAITILTVSFLSYSTVAGLVGGGGIGDFAIRYGYYRYETEIMFFTILLIVIFVQVLQFTGNAVVRKLDKRL